VAITDPKDTLAFHQSRVLTTHRDMSHVPCANVAFASKEFDKNDLNPQAKPETEALWFYGMNHGMALIASEFAPLEPLPEWELQFVNMYHQLMAEKAVRAFNYLVLICTREFRHNQSLAKHAPEIGKQFGQPVQDFFVSVKGGEHGIKEAFLNNPPAATIGDYTKALQWGFYHCKWNGGYGGKAWGAVTDCLVRFVTGEFTAEMMLDTVWTLCHNNGPIFNKGFLYSMCTQNLVKILDVQRSGQVIEAVLTDKHLQDYAPPGLKQTLSAVTGRFAGQIGEYVNWELVEALGSVHKYPTEKQAQFAKHGMSPEAKAAQTLAEKKAMEAQAIAEAKLAEHKKNWFQVMPGLEVKKVHRAA
jgi:hypothetical protein